MYTYALHEAVESPADIRIGYYSEGILAARQVKGFCGGGEGDEYFIIVAYGGARYVNVVAEYHVVVYLIGYHVYAMLFADVQHGLQLIALPYPARGVVGGGEYKELHAVFHDLLFKVRKIYGVYAAGIYKVAADEPAAVVFHGVHKGVIYRRLHYDGVAGFGEHLQKPVESRYYAGCKAQPFFLHLIAVIFAFPVYECLMIAWPGNIIAEHACLHVVLNGGHDAVRHAEIHIRYPHCLKVAAAKCGFQIVPLAGIGAPPVYEYYLFLIIACCICQLMLPPDKSIWIIVHFRLYSKSKKRSFEKTIIPYAISLN